MCIHTYAVFYFHIYYMHVYFMHAMKHLSWFLLIPALFADLAGHNCLSLNQLILSYNLPSVRDPLAIMAFGQDLANNYLLLGKNDLAQETFLGFCWRASELGCFNIRLRNCHHTTASLHWETGKGL